MIVTEWNYLPHSVNGDSTLLRYLEVFILNGFKIKKTNLYSCSFSKSKCVILKNTQAFMNNGITWDKKNRIYASDTMEKKVKEYVIKINSSENDFYDYYISDKTLIDFDPNNNKIDFTKIVLVLNKEYDTIFLNDNLIFDAKNNRIYVSLIKEMLQYISLSQYIKGNKRLPNVNEYNNLNQKEDVVSNFYHSGIGEIDLYKESCKLLVLYIYLDNVIMFTSKYLAGSSAFYDEGKVYMGSWCENRFLVCNMNHMKN